MKCIYLFRIRFASLKNRYLLSYPVERENKPKPYGNSKDDVFSFGLSCSFCLVIQVDQKIIFVYEKSFFEGAWGKPFLSFQA